MSKQTVTLHMYQSTCLWNEGERTVHDMDFRDIPDAMKSRIYLGSQDVEIDWPEIDTTAAQIDALEAQVQAERAESQVRVNLLLERISKLRAIGHEVAQ